MQPSRNKDWRVVDGFARARSFFLVCVCVVLSHSLRVSGGGRVCVCVRGDDVARALPFFFLSAFLEARRRRRYEEAEVTITA